MFSAILISAAACGGGVCQQAVVVRQKAVYAAPYVAPYVVAPQVSYFVGAAIRESAIVQQQLNQDPDYKDFLAFKAWKQQQAEAEQPQAMEQNAVQQQCAMCHGTAEPKGGFYMDGSPGMSAEAITKAIRMIASDKMPPPTSGHRLTREEKNALLTTLLSLEAGQSEQPPPEPQPQGGEE